MNLVLETERLIMRPLELSDAEDFFAMNNNPNVYRYLRTPIQTITQAEEYIEKISIEYEKYGIARFAVILKKTNTLIGFSGLRFRANLDNNHINFYDLGYRFAEPHWRNGFATESAHAWLDYGFATLKLPAIHACAFSDNVGSNKVLQKVGFTYINQYSVNNVMYNWYTIENIFLNK
jgi:[ribosomal protein S5]-alanine N-acetyltransferase